MTVFNSDLSGQLNPNCYDQSRGPIVLLVCHNTSGPFDRNPGNLALSNQAANYLASNDRQVSVHYLIGAEDGGAQIYRIVPEGFTAYHAGGTAGYPSHWTDPDTGKSYGGYSLNQVSIGVELFGQPWEPVGPRQSASLQRLVEDLAKRYPVLARPGHIVTHRSLEGDRQDGPNWVRQAVAWAKGVVNKVQDHSGGFTLNSDLLAELTKRGHVAITNQQKYLPDLGQDGLTPRSFLWAKDPATQEGFVYIWYAPGVVKVNVEV